MFIEKNGALEYRFDNEILRIEAWGEHALRVRASKNSDFTGRSWALDPQDGHRGAVAIYDDTGRNGGAYANMYEGEDQSYGLIKNGKLKAVINAGGVICFTNQKGEILLKENFRRLRDETSMALNIAGREYKNVGGDNYRIAVRFMAKKEEKIFGMGQYQQHELNMKGCLLELAQRNSQASVPFYISSVGYGFLWNNPAIGQVMFANNGTEWVASSTKEIDYLVIAGDSPAEIEENYASLTGKAPMMPEYGMGFWQCKLRYRTQEELMSVARKYKELDIPLDVIVCDFFHWPHQGDYCFDPKYWPDAEGMCKELEELGIKLMVSIWPTVQTDCSDFRKMQELGYLTRAEEGVKLTMTGIGDTVFYDATNPEAREFVWKKVKKNYWDKGARLFWLDVAEPEYTTYEFENYRYALGSNLEVGNIYPKLYLKGFYDGMTEAGDPNPLSLIRCAWAGSARYGALVWSGDILSSFECFNRQLRAGLSMAMAGIPWWTTDIGGFHGADYRDPAFHELFARWFAYACFCPVMRLHGNRNPQFGYGDGEMGSGSDNEIWSFGEEIFTICKFYINLREKLRDYIREQMKLTHEKGTPIMRPVFYDFPEDPLAWNVDDAYMFGPQLYVAPVMEASAKERKVYLPEGETWADVWTGQEYAGGQSICVKTPLEQIPVFARKGSSLLSLFT